MAPIRHASPKAMTTVRIGFEVLLDASIRKIPGMQGGLVRFGRSYALVKQVSREGPIDVWMRIGALNI
jgi:hypothetical protein